MPLSWEQPGAGSWEPKAGTCACAGLYVLVHECLYVWHTVLRRTTTYYDVLRRTTKYYDVLECNTTYCDVLRRASTCQKISQLPTIYYYVTRSCNVSQLNTAYYDVVKPTPMYYDVLRCITK